MGLIRSIYQVLALVCKCTKDGTTGSINACTLCAIMYHLFSKAPECMIPKVRSQGPVFGILKAAHAPNHCLATLGSTGKKVVQPAIMILNQDVVYLEECVDSQAPSLLESL